MAIESIKAFTPALTASGGYLEYLPAGYNSSLTYPLIINLLGDGEGGAGDTAALTALAAKPAIGIVTYIENGAWRASNFDKFIIITPQFNKVTENAADYTDYNAVIDKIISLYAGKYSQLFLTGLSFGAGVVEEYLSFGSSRNSIVGAIICAGDYNPSVYIDNSRINAVAATGARLWFFHNQTDGTVPYADSAAWQQDLTGHNGAQSVFMLPIPRLTSPASSAHDCWTGAFNPAAANTNVPNPFAFLLGPTAYTPVSGPTFTPTSNSPQVYTNGVSIGYSSGTAATGRTIAGNYWSKVSGPTGDVIAAPASQFTSISFTQPGTYVYALTVYDDYSDYTTQNITITVNNSPGVVNPTVSTTGSKAIQLPTNSVGLGVNYTVNSGTLAGRQWTQTSGPNTATFDSSTASFPTVSGLIAGTYVFTITITQSDGGTASATQTVVVSPAAGTVVNPTVTTNAAITITLPTNSAGLSCSYTVNSGSLSARVWSQVSGPNTATFDNNTNQSPTVSGLIQGVYVFKITITQSDGGTNSATQQVTVNAAGGGVVNPTVNAGTNQNVLLANSPINLSGTAAAGGSSTVSSTVWSITSGPTGGAFNNANILAPTFSFTQVGTYVLKLTVTDADGGTANSSVTITVSAAASQPAFTTTPASISESIYTWMLSNIRAVNTIQPSGVLFPVSIAGANQSAVLGTGVTLDGSASVAPSGTIVSQYWQKVSGPAGDIIATPTGLTTTVSYTGVGTYIYQLTVLDSNGNTATSETQVIITAAAVVNPTVSAGLAQSIQLPTSSVNLVGTATPGAGSTITSTIWTQNSNNPTGATLSANNILNPIAYFTQPGSYQFILTVLDADGGTVTSTVTIVVSAAGSIPVINPPTVSAGPNQSVTGTTATLNGATSPGSAPIASINWTLLSGTGVIAYPDYLTTPVTGLSLGVNQFELTVVGSDGGIGVASVTITVSLAIVNPTVEISFNQQNNTSYAPSPFNLLGLTGNQQNTRLILRANRLILGFMELISFLRSVTGQNTANTSGLVVNGTIYLDWNNLGNGMYSLTISGLSPAMLYDIDFYVFNPQSIVQFTIGGKTSTLNAAGSGQNRLSIDSILPDQNGTILVTSNLSGVLSFGILNFLVLTQHS